MYAFLLKINVNAECPKLTGILFVSDFIVNAGGAIGASAEALVRSEDETKDMIENIYNTCMKTFERSKQKGCTPIEAAEELARRIIQKS